MDKGKKSKPGPEEERLKLEGDWQDNIGKALKKKRPDGGWPKGDSTKRPKSKP